MSRRAAPSGQPMFLPPQPAKRVIEDPNESSFSRFLRTEVYAPDKLPGNLSIVTGIGIFLAGIAAVRTWGDLMIPA
ncbi:hypothetical protein AMATHDRAFT_150486 [Amanita thiersii Skay4041]|uniref:Uncharacterized protein n=1 Tax=Amanita thiersii Skay4041 TaxID=703135 RepID=A0A2A9NK82_9AGAR|nr:hypothetical protein AMATHDRAFT_150486 [Amanita thiersii Skay4041]